VQADRPAATNAATVFEPAAPPPAPKPQPSAPAPTVAESAPMPSVATVPQMPKATGEIPQVAPATASKSKAGLLIAAVVLVVLLVGGGVAGFLIWNKSRSNTVATTGPTSNTTNANVTAAGPRELTTYWLEVAPSTEGEKSTRVGLAPIASGQALKFHFTFTEDGYLYIFGPGANNQPTAFLTTNPSADSGVTSNKVVAGRDFSFPKGEGNDLTLDEKPGTDNFTVIFSKTLLTAPEFLTVRVTGKPLPAAQQADFKAFAAKYQEKAPLTEHDDSTAGAPAVRIKVPPDQTGNPVVFAIRIQHN
jgi:hypothetical protein